MSDEFPKMINNNQEIKILRLQKNHNINNMSINE
jgi:hypothetical protein